MIDFILWALIGWFAFGILFIVAAIGKPRKPSTPAIAAGAVAILGSEIAGLVYVLVNR